MANTEKKDPVARKQLPRHSFETRQKALEIFRNGGSYKNCARALNIPVYTARDWHRSYLIGTFRAERGARQQVYTAEQKATVLRLRREEGKSRRLIEQLFCNGSIVLTKRRWKLKLRRLLTSSILYNIKTI